MDAAPNSKLMSMNITTITLVDAGVNQEGRPRAKVEFKPLVGDSLEAKVIVMHVGDTLTTDLPVSFPDDGILSAELVG